MTTPTLRTWVVCLLMAVMSCAMAMNEPGPTVCTRSQQ